MTGADLGKMLTDLLENERQRRKVLGGGGGGPGSCFPGNFQISLEETLQICELFSQSQCPCLFPVILPKK